MTRQSQQRPVLPDGGGGTIVGLAAGDCVVLAADTRATRGTTVASEKAEKIAQIHPSGAMGAPTPLGSVQEFLRVIRSLVEEYRFERGEPMDLSSLATRAASELAMHRIGLSFVLGGVDEEGPQVYQLDPEGAVLGDAAVVLGGGQQVAAGVLESHPESLADLDRESARELAVEALAAAAERDTETGEGVQLAEITDQGIETDRYDTAEAALEPER